MSESPQQTETEEIFVAIPPPLVTPLVRQFSSSHENSSSSTFHPSTPISTNSSSQQSLAQWTLDHQYQRALLYGTTTSSSSHLARVQTIGQTQQGQAQHGNHEIEAELFPPPISSSPISSSLSSSSSVIFSQIPQQQSQQQLQQQQQQDTSSTQSMPSSTTRLPLSPVSPALPSQLLNRLYSFSTVTNPSPTTETPSATSITRSSHPDLNIGITNPNFFSSSFVAGTTPATTVTTTSLSTSTSLGNGGGGNRNIFDNESSSRMFMQTSLLGDSSPAEMRRGRGSVTSMTESTRTAAATAIMDSMNRGDLGMSRGENPYIPSSLSMLFTDPEVMQFQEEVERAQLYQHQLGQRQRYLDSRRSFSGDSGLRRGISGSSNNDISVGQVEIVEEDEEFIGQDEYDEVVGHGNILSPHTTEDQQQQQLLLMASRQADYGYELVIQGNDEQDGGQVYHPYDTVMSQSDFLAPHEPSSSSPLFPSPLTTLGRFTTLSDQLEVERQGRIWQGYGTMDMSHNRLLSQSNSNLQSNSNNNLSPLNQSHGAYYHAVSNHQYSQEDLSRIGSNSISSISAPCEPATSNWRRLRGRDVSYQSYTSIGGDNSSGNNQQRWYSKWFSCGQRGDSQEDNWLCGMLVSIVGCWVCCESPLACCSGCC